MAYTFEQIVKGTIGIISSYIPGKHKVEPEVATSRLKLCSECDHMKENNGNFKCGICGCYLKSKVVLKIEKCPINKW